MKSKQSPQRGRRWRHEQDRDEEHGAAVITFCDSQLTNEDFNETGDAFVKSYYVQHFFDDYCKSFEGAYEAIYHVEDSRENASKIVPVLDRRFEGWQDRKPWWKFW